MNKTKAQQDHAHLSLLGYDKSYSRSMTLWSAIALGFTYLSPLVAVYALFDLGLSSAGPGSIFWILIVGLGQLFVALVMGEVASQYPIAGGIYPWMRRLAGKKSAWLVAWIYAWSMLVTVTSVAEYGVKFLSKALGISSPSLVTQFFLAISFLLLALFLNFRGTKTLARIARLGLFAELIGVIGLGFYLLIFHAHNDIRIFWSSFSLPHYGSAFFSAALVGLFMFYGFEACGDVAEEVENASYRVPKSMYLTILVSGISAFVSFSGYVLAAPPHLLQAIASGENIDSIGLILDDVLGPLGSRLFLIIVITAFISCILSLQAAASRLIYSFARDHMLPMSDWLSQVSSHTHAPKNALILASCVPILLCAIISIQPAYLIPITAFAVLGIYLSFQSVVFSSLLQRCKGWVPAGPWSLGSWGFLINLIAFLYGIAAILWLLKPNETGTMIERYVTHIGLLAILIPGLIYLFIARPDKRSHAPHSDAIAISKQLFASSKKK